MVMSQHRKQMFSMLTHNHLTLSQTLTLNILLDILVSIVLVLVTSLPIPLSTGAYNVL